MDVVKQNASSCGFIGGNISSAMNQALKDGSADTPNFLTAVDQGRAGRAALTKQLLHLNSGNEEMAAHLDLIRYGLSTDDAQHPDCKRASVAFEEMRRLAILQSQNLQSVIHDLAQPSKGN